ncbi:LysR family transcriptional regulator [Dasania sp. GY-MA-18]|uniref:LysR family transcriptional regulator n=1 Tax=Dasania phycosphaerae TaxID=2950436 RepID=A0A9J6RMQ9_9GAMM|nr:MULTISPECIES: LysR family transcriptional regulator [Dasania]MCR8922838.1 LysR family transcriptional regulator [Dasania sp. GY-MA-18]MCZ0865269.1 LysR family transcriptional regulator [Dasania phycosphaerae]MCZ0868994.1 LysR family transcriptional regulator [Dasania phycosphaerae]
MTATRHHLSHLYGFYTVAKHHSFTRAAEELCVTQSAVSYQIKKLESLLNVQLLDRRCRNTVRLTSTGEILAAKCQSIFSELDHLFESLSGKNVGGSFTIAAPTCFGSVFMPKVAARVKSTHPDLKLKLALEDKLVDIVSNNIDVAIRVNTLVEGLQYKPLMKVRMQLVASPEYQAQHGIVGEGSDLANHQIIMGQMDDSDWASLLSQNPELAIAADEVTYINNTLAILEAARAGLGIGYLPYYLVADDLAQGSLATVLPEIHSSITYFVCYDKSLEMEQKLKVLLEAISSTLHQSVYVEAFEWLAATPEAPPIESVG